MATNNYAVPLNFPNGLNLDLLTREMLDVWPRDLASSEYSANGRPQDPNGIETGTLSIETPRDLTPAENTAALAHFQTHEGGRAMLGQLLADLPPPGQPGRWVFVDAVERQPGANTGTGAMVYDDGTNWRRHGDDEVIA